MAAFGAEWPPWVPTGREAIRHWPRSVPSGRVASRLVAMRSAIGRVRSRLEALCAATGYPASPLAASPAPGGGLCPPARFVSPAAATVVADLPNGAFVLPGNGNAPCDGFGANHRAAGHISRHRASRWGGRAGRSPRSGHRPRRGGGRAYRRGHLHAIRSIPGIGPTSRPPAQRARLPRSGGRQPVATFGTSQYRRDPRMDAPATERSRKRGYSATTRFRTLPFAASQSWWARRARGSGATARVGHRFPAPAPLRAATPAVPPTGAGSR